MEDESENPTPTSEIARLRALGTWMRDVGATELTLGDVHIKLAPKTPEAPGRTRALDEGDEEDQRLSVGEREHVKFWRRATRSSGAPIPPYKPRESQ